MDLSLDQFAVYLIGGLILYAIWRVLKPVQKLNPSKSTDQIILVKRAQFSSKKLMNKFEYRIYKVVCEWAGPDHLIFAQVNLGEFLKTGDYLAFRSINSKRVDFLVIDRWGEPVVAIECQGSGHYRSNATDRDLVKALALKSAGIPLIEVFERTSKIDICRLLDQAKKSG